MLNEFAVADILCLLVIAYKLSVHLSHIAAEQAAYRDGRSSISRLQEGSKNILKKAASARMERQQRQRGRA